MSSSPPAPTSAPVIPASLRDEHKRLSGACQPAIETPTNFRRARCWWSAPALPARRSPKSCCAPAAASISSVGRHTRLPRRYRGRDLIWWLSEMGIDQTPVEQRGPSRLLPVITGAYGGHTIDFRRFAADGVTLLGRVDGGA